MGARSKARKRALEILYEADLRGVAPHEVLQWRIAQGHPPITEYTVVLVDAIEANKARIDELIGAHSVGWTLDRMPAVDRNILRIGAYELLGADDVPEDVAISEAVLLAQDMSTEESPAFVNGLLAKLKELSPSLY